eukprot:8140625-Ditylum_brightwellii.AAC.1
MVAMDIDKQQKRKKADTRQGLQKSDEIHFYTGVYEGKVGWFDASKLKTDSRITAIADMGQGVLKKATVSAWSVTQHHPIKPPSFAHALVAPKPDIDKLIMKLAKQKMFARQPRSLLILMTESLEKALVTLVEEKKEVLRTW